MNLGSMEERTEGIRKQASELIGQAYHRGYQAGYSKAENDYYAKTEDDRQSSYELGLNMAWEAARKILNACNSANKVLDEVFGTPLVLEIINTCPPSEAIEKLRAYEEQKKQDEEIKVGDEVRWIINPKYIGLVTYVDYLNNMIWIMGHDGRHFIGCSNEIEKYERTGRHFSDMDELIKKMQEGE